MIADKRLFTIIIELKDDEIYARLLIHGQEVVNFIKFMPDGTLPEDAAEAALREMFARLEGLKSERYFAIPANA